MTSSAWAAAPAPQPGHMTPSQVAAIQDDLHACQPFRVACMGAGFVLTNAVKGDRLVTDCMIPLLAGKSATNSVNHQVALPPMDADVAGCKAHMHHGHKPSMGLHSMHPPKYK